jgi:hypothetical protein
MLQYLNFLRKTFYQKVIHLFSVQVEAKQDPYHLKKVSFIHPSLFQIIYSNKFFLAFL